MKKLLLHLFVMALLIGQTQAVQVEAEGRAAGDQKTAREQALADALREAVRKGTGVDVLASTGVSNFALDFDRILSSAFGHVKSYEVISSRLGQDQIYRVKIQADVEKGTPDAKNTLALRELMQRKGAPRVAIRIRERLPESDGKDSLQHVLEDAAKGMQFFVVDPATRADFVIEGEVAMKYLGRETLHGRPPQHSFAATGIIRAVRGDTGEVIAVDNLSGKNSVGGTAFAKEDAAHEALDLVARPNGNAEASPTILNKILARWITETDLGAIKRLEFSSISTEDFQKIQTHLADTEKISAVWPREFDSQGISVLDVETRLDNMGLGQEVTKATSNRVKLDRSTENLLAFNSNGAGTSAPAAQGDAKSNDKPWWKVW
jgi:Flagellar assembly protein T, N-terminal domain